LWSAITPAGERNQRLASVETAAASDAERDQLGAQHPELAGVNLRRAFADQILRCYRRPFFWAPFGAVGNATTEARRE
jgi:hypothetical protein